MLVTLCSTNDPDERSADDRGFRRRLAWVLVAAAIVRVIHLATKWNRPLRLNDSVWYSAMASGLRRGEFFRHLVVPGAPSAEHPPLASLLMTPGSFLPDSVNGQRLTTCIAGVIGVALIGVLARRIGGARLGIVAASLAAVYPNLWLNDGLVMSESIAIALVVGALLALHSVLERPTRRNVIGAGALLGAAALTRSELVMLVPLTAALIIARERSRAATGRAIALTGVALALMAPWAAANMARFDRPVLLTTNDGTTLLGSYCDDIFSGANKGGWSVFCVFDAPDPGGDDSVRSSAQRSMAITYARDHARELPGVVVARVARALDLYGLDDMVGGDVGEEKPRVFVWAGIVVWWLLMVPAAIGFAALRRRDRWLLALPLLSSATATVVFYGGHRLRAPAEPVIVILASVTVCAVWKRVERRSDRFDPSSDRSGDHASDPVGADVGEITTG